MNACRKCIWKNECGYLEKVSCTGRETASEIKRKIKEAQNCNNIKLAKALTQLLKGGEAIC